MRTRIVNTLPLPLLLVVVLLRPRGNTLLVWHRVGVGVGEGVAAGVAVVAVVVDPPLSPIALAVVVPYLLTPPSSVLLLPDPQNAMERRWC